MRRYIKHSRKRLNTFPNVLKFIKNIPLRVVFSTLFLVLGNVSERNLTCLIDCFSGLCDNFLPVSIHKLNLNRLKYWAVPIFEVTQLKVSSLNTSSSTVTKQFIYIIIWSKSTPRPSRLYSCTSVVSSAAIDEWEHTAKILRGTFAAGTWRMKTDLIKIIQKVKLPTSVKEQDIGGFLLLL